MMSTHIHDEAKRRLEAEHIHLVDQLAKLGATEDGELRSDVDFGEGFADAAAATAERTETIGLAESIHRMLKDIDAALARLEQGTYGVCAKCGQNIPEARLDFRPESIFCVSCKSAA